MASIQPRYKTKGGEPVLDRHGRRVVASWRVIYRPEPGALQRTEKFPGTRQGEKDAEAFLAALESGETPEARTMTLSALEARWYAEHVAVRCAESTWERDYRPHVDNRIRPMLGNVKLGKLTEKRLEEFVNDMLAGNGCPKASANTVNGTMKTLSAILGWAASPKRKLMPTNPAATFERLDHAKEEIVVPSKDQVRVLAEAMPTPDARAAVLTGAYAGLRRGEVFSLAWRHIAPPWVQVRRTWVHDRVGKSVDELFKLPKGRTVRSTPLLPFLADTLEEWRASAPWSDDDDLIFPNSDGELEHPSNWYNRVWVATRNQIADRVEEWGEACAELAASPAETKAIRKRTAREASFYRRVKFHWLRHYFVSMMASRRVASYEAVMEWVGHVDEETAKIYRRMFQADVERMVEQLQAAIDEW